MKMARHKSIVKNFCLFVTISFYCFNAIAVQLLTKGEKALIVYFSQPENISLADVDGRTGASVIVKNDTTLGSTQYIASIIQQQTGGDLFRIETVNSYPLVHEPLIRYAEKEQQENVHPALKNKPNNLSKYDVVFIGYPIWWYKMPMALYSFFDQNDFRGKTIVPFTTHGGSHFSDSIDEIKRLEPNANVLTNGLDISRNDVANDNTQTVISDWLKTL